MYPNLHFQFVHSSAVPAPRPRPSLGLGGNPGDGRVLDPFGPQVKDFHRPRANHSAIANPPSQRRILVFAVLGVQAYNSSRYQVFGIFEE